MNGDDTAVCDLLHGCILNELGEAGRAEPLLEHVEALLKVGLYVYYLTILLLISLMALFLRLFGIYSILFIIAVVIAF